MPDMLILPLPALENRAFALYYFKNPLKVTWERKQSKDLLIPFGFGQENGITEKIQPFIKCCC